jgi:hypothetical protein
MAQTTRSTFANIASSQTDAVIIAGDLNLRTIKVVSVAFVAGGTATNATFNSKGSGAGTAISCLFANGANGGAILNRNEDGWFNTNAGEALTLTTGGGSTTGVLVNYVYV